MSLLQRNRYNMLYMLLPAGLLIALIPFLRADPDTALSISRDAFTDEGLNTIQVRNWINDGHLDVKECDNFVKMPLFSLLMASGFAILGTGWTAARLTAFAWTMFFLGLAWIRMGPKKPFLLLFIPIGLFNYYTFQYLRFSMAESMTSAAILWSVAEFVRAWQQMEKPPLNRRRYARIWLMPVLSVWICTALKSQFAYLLPLWFLWFGWGLWLQRRSGIREILLRLAVAGGLFVLAGILILTVFYLPFRDTLYFIMEHQTSGRFAGLHNLYDEARENMRRLFGHPRLEKLPWLFIPALLLGILAHRFRSDRPFVLLSGLLLLWFAAEWHKFGIRWLPSRYLVPLFWAAAAWTALVLRQLWTGPYAGRQLLFKSLATAFFSVVLIAVYRQVVQLYQGRSYTIQEANEQVARRLPAHTGGVVLGPWAPALTWHTKLRAVPVWRHFLNGNDFDTRYQAAAWISEADQGDNEGAFAAKGIDLRAPGIRTDSFFIRDKWILFRPAE